ncbi:MAG: nucleoside-diphosphate sugar epimerase/dehydratase [Gammaproteobacteria bacterium]
MKFPERFRTPLAAFLHDLMMVPLAWFLAFSLRFNLGSIPETFMDAAIAWLPLLMAIQACAFIYLGLYRGVWRFASLPDLLRIIKAVMIGAGVSAVVIFLLVRLENIPRSVFPLYAILLVTALGASRFIYRAIKDHGLYQEQGQKVLIVGAGQAGEMLVRDLYRDRSNAYTPVGFVDDSPGKQSQEIQGLRVLGKCGQIPALIEKQAVELIIIAVPSATSLQMQRIVEMCEETDVPFRTLPCLDDLVAGRVTTQSLRDVSIDDLLGRESAHLNWDSIRQGIVGKKVLVTGGGGSIGSGLARELAKLEPQALIIFDQSEHNLYQIENELRQDYPLLDFYGQLADITDSACVNHVMHHHQPDIVFHAAAYKHVPMLEGQVREAIKNNVIGTSIVAAAAHKAKCETFVLISTDKAVNPGNVMGASKRVGEIYCQNLNQQSATRFITVRFGNVLDSTGSVVPLFRKQIARGGPVTVTHPDIERYFMTIPEACQLILQAGSMGVGGEIFVLDMGKPVSIVYLAEQMIRLSGKIPGEEIDIVYTGLRPGEKLYEELFHKDEALKQTGHQSILLADYRPVDWEHMTTVLENIEVASAEYDSRMLAHLLQQLVPEWARENQDVDVAFESVIDKPTAAESQPPQLH